MGGVSYHESDKDFKSWLVVVKLTYTSCTCKVLHMIKPT
jgi:hypothetical protein